MTGPGIWFTCTGRHTHDPTGIVTGEGRPIARQFLREGTAFHAEWRCPQCPRTLRLGGRLFTRLQAADIEAVGAGETVTVDISFM